MTLAAAPARPPGPKNASLLLGVLPSSARTRRIFLENVAREYGDFVYIPSGPQHVYLREPSRRDSRHPGNPSRQLHEKPHAGARQGAAGRRTADQRRRISHAASAAWCSRRFIATGWPRYARGYGGPRGHARRDNGSRGDARHASQEMMRLTLAIVAENTIQRGCIVRGGRNRRAR